MNTIDEIKEAIETMLDVLSPAQLKHLAEKMKSLQRRGWGELRLTFRNGHVDELICGESDRMTLIK
jgi:hypothetical protein